MQLDHDRRWQGVPCNVRHAIVVVGASVLAALASNAAAQTCREEVGRQRSQELVRQCTEVSPATRPPCNAENACSLILDEIRRGCTILANGDDVSSLPKFCERPR